MPELDDLNFDSDERSSDEGAGDEVLEEYSRER